VRLKQTNLIHLEIYGLKFKLFFSIFVETNQSNNKDIIKRVSKKTKTTCQQNQRKMSYDNWTT